MNRKYYLNFEGTIGDFIKQRRKAKKINSVDLSKELGKGGAYISQIENGHNKRPDFDMLYEIFKRIGIEDERIEDYLEGFGFISPEREEMELRAAIHSQNMSMEEYQEIQRQEAEYFSKHSENYNNGDTLLKDIFNSNINRINSALSRIAVENKNDGFKFVGNLENTISNMSKDSRLYKFLLLFFDNDLDILDEDGIVKVINKLYEELNRCQKGSPWGISSTTTIKQPINKL